LSCSICPLLIIELGSDDSTYESINEASRNSEYSGVSTGYGVLATSGVFSNDDESLESYERKSNST
jgi:hypothetical protein